MKKIPLTQGKFATVDDEYEYLAQWKWFFDKGYARRWDYPEGAKGKKVPVVMHRLINQTPEGMDTDHINLDTLDNRKSNLRTATRGQNMKNKKVRSDSGSGQKGVSYHGGKWRASIQIDGKRMYLGVFANKTEAAMAYDAAALQAFGEFARINAVISTTEAT